MAQFNPSNQTVQVTTGNVRTTVDLPNTSLANPFPYPTGVFPNPLGSVFWDNVVTTANLNGRPTKYRYLQMKLTATPTILTGPSAVWYTDKTMTTITATKSEAWGDVSSFAGFLMPNSTDISTLTTAILKNGAASTGAAVWVAVGGWVDGAVTSATTAGDQLFATQADWTTTGGFSRVAAGGATVGRISAVALAATPDAVYVMAESL